MKKTGELVIRRAVAGDVPELNSLIESSVRGLGLGDYTTAEIEGAVGKALGLDRQLIEDGTYFVAVTPDGSLAGCGGWSFRRKLCGGDGLDGGGCGPAVEITGEEDVAKIRAIYVHPEWARMGLGSAILKHVEAAAAAAGFRRLEMGSTLTGVALYRQRGYRETERMGIPLPNGEVLGVVKMVKNL